MLKLKETGKSGSWPVWTIKNYSNKYELSWLIVFTNAYKKKDKMCL